VLSGIYSGTKVFQVRMYSLQISSPPRPNFFSVSPISPSLKSESESNIQHPTRTCHHRLCSCIVGSRTKSRWQHYNPTLIASTLRLPTPYLNAPISTISTSPSHSTHPTVRHTHLPPDVIQRKPCQAASLIGKHLRGCLIFHSV
jgi:hypothetical protein